MRILKKLTGADDNYTAPPIIQPPTNPITVDAPLDDIFPGRWQPRQTFRPDKMHELALSIFDHGIITPLVAILSDDAGQNKYKYELIAGERRWRASIAVAMARAGYTSLENAVNIVCDNDYLQNYLNLKHPGSYLNAITVPVAIQDSQDAEHLAIISVADNLQRDDLNPIEEAQALAALRREYGYSIRQLAEIVGRSKSWVDERLKLLELAPEVQAMVAPAPPPPADQPGQAPGPEAPPLDLKLAQLIARKIPAGYQTAVGAWLRDNGGNLDIKTLQNFINTVARFVDLETWTPPAGEPLQAEKRNRARLICHYLEILAPETIIAAIAEIDVPIGSTTIKNNYYSSTVLRQLADGAGITDHTDKWNCDNCLLRGVESFPVRDAELDRYIPCLRVSDENIPICDHYLALDDPPHVEVKYHLRIHLTDEQLAGLVKVDDYTYFSADVPAFIAAYGQALTNKKEAQQQQRTEQQQKHGQEIRAYYNEITNLDTQLNLGNFYACICRHCHNYREDGSICHYANQPIIGPANTSRSPQFFVWATQDGRLIPRCEMFHYRMDNCPEIEPLELVVIGSLDDEFFQLGPDPRAILLHWFERLSSDRYTSYSFDGPLTWLPYPRSHTKAHSLKDLLKYLHSIGETDSAKMWKLMDIGLQEIDALANYHSLKELTHAGQLLNFVVISFNDYLIGRRPHTLPDDWPAPWVKEEEK